MEKNSFKQIFKKNYKVIVPSAIGFIFIAFGVILFVTMCSITPRYTQFKGNSDVTLIEKYDEEGNINSDKFYIVENYQFNDTNKQYTYNVDQLFNDNNTIKKDRYMIKISVTFSVADEYKNFLFEPMLLQSKIGEKEKDFKINPTNTYVFQFEDIKKEDTIVFNIETMPLYADDGEKKPASYLEMDNIYIGFFGV